MRIRTTLAPAGLAAAALAMAACGSSPASGSPAAASSPAANAHTSSAPASGPASSQLKTRKIKGTTVVTNSKGFTLYWFAPDTPTMSKCNGTCATFWPSVKGHVTAGPGVTGKIGTIKRSDGSVQATYNGHPLYTYKLDTAPGQAKGNKLNLNGGVWHEVTPSGKASAAPRSSSKSRSGGYGY